MLPNEDNEQYPLDAALSEIEKVKYVLTATGSSDEAVTYIEQTADCMKDLVLNVYGSTPMSPLDAYGMAIELCPPPSYDIWLEVQAALPITIAMDRDYQRTGHVSISPSPEAQLAGLPGKPIERKEGKAQTERVVFSKS